MSANRDDSGPETDFARWQEGLAFLGQARQVPSLSPSDVEQIARRLKRHRHRPRPQLLWPALIAVALVLIGGATLAVAKGGLGALPLVGPFLRPQVVPAPPAARPKVARRPSPLPKAEVASPPVLQPVAPLPEPSPAAEPPKPVAAQVISRREVAYRTSRELHNGAQTNPLPEPAPPIEALPKNPLVEEGRSFARIIGSWHQTRNASTILSLLDEHERRYPNGYMNLESRVLRAEIYLAQGRERASLSVLDTLSLAGIPRGRELQVVRGELRIKFGRCAEGKQDVGEVLQKGVADPLAKRAVQAISRCP